MPLTPTRLIWMDGALIPWEQAQVHVLTPSLHYGWGVYEGIRAYETDTGSAVFRLREHIARLRRSARVYLMELPWTDDELIDAVLELVRVNGENSCYIRPIAYLGYGEMGVTPQLDAVRLSIAVWPWGSYLGHKAETEGCRLIVSNWQRSSHQTVPPLAKATGAYVNSALAKVGALRAGYDDALMLTASGHIAEASAANLFLVHDGELITPPVSDGILPGITRDTVITFARDLGMTVTERSVPRPEVYLADEAFLTGTAAEIVPVASVDERPVGVGGAGPVAKQMRALFQEVAAGRNSTYTTWLERV